MAVVAVLLIHMDRKAVVPIKPSIILRKYNKKGGHRDVKICL